MLILPISKKKFDITLSRKVPGDYVKTGQYQDIGINNKIISGKE